MSSTVVSKLFSVEGRVALVTGGVSGIGLMMAEVCLLIERNSLGLNPQGLVSNGAKVYVCGLPSDLIKDVERKLNNLGQGSGGSAIG
jgi:short-subunit dehydrogenase involved in D-alanine esterification of teichoic acids